jgi:hypothetical protein
MKFRRRTAMAVLAMALCVRADAAPPEAPPPPLAIKGYDPVAYFTLQRATPGVAQYEYEWDEHRWQFANSRHRDMFKADPVRYAPQFENFCAVALARGEVREASPEFWLIVDDKLYLFGKAVGPDAFRKDLESTLERAEHNRGLLPGKP